MPVFTQPLNRRYRDAAASNGRNLGRIILVSVRNIVFVDDRGGVIDCRRRNGRQFHFVGALRHLDDVIFPGRQTQAAIS